PLIPEPPRAEILEHSERRIRVPEPLKRLVKELFSTLEIRVTCRDVIEANLTELGEQRHICVQVGPETLHALKPRIDETQGDHRWQRHAGVLEHREFVHEITVGELPFDRPRIPLVGKDFLGDSHLVAEKCELLPFSFEVRYVLISENEIQGNEPHSDVLG